MARYWVIAIVVAGLLGCGRAPKKPESSADRASPPGPTRAFLVKGVIVAVKPREKTVEIKHETIPDYMPGMTMPFDVKDTNLLTGLKPGDQVQFRLVTTDTDAWIDQIHELESSTNSNAMTNNGTPLPGPPTSGTFRRVKDVEPLQIGDSLPEYNLTNQFGQPFSTGRYHGQALAITFLFTRCPYPTFCPRMANNFAEVQNKLLAGSPTNWQLLTVSFDPEFDTPAVLQAYAQAHQCRPERWTFATGSLEEINALTDQAGLTFWHDESGSINHNLRTVVVNAAGKVQQIFVGNQWSSGDLVDEMLKAAKGG